MKQWIFCVILFLLSSKEGQLFAQKAEIDLRIDTSSTKHYVGLAVRDDTFTGHAFVIMYKQDQEDTVKKDFKVYGYYPKTIATIPIPIGIVKNDLNCLSHIPPNGEIYFIVDSTDYAEAKKVVNEWSANPPTFTLIKNCIDMLDEVAMSIGVDLPSRYKSIPSLVPEHYMKYVYKKVYSSKGVRYKKNYRLKVVDGMVELSKK